MWATLSKTNLAFIFLLYGITSLGQVRIGAPMEGIGHATSTVSSIWSVWANPAGLSQLEGPSIGFSFRNIQEVEGFNSTGLAIGAPFKGGAFGLGLSRFGDQLFNEQLASISYAHKLGITDLGIRIAYQQYHFEGFGNKGVPVLSFGGITTLSPHFLIGAFIQNINQAKISDFEDERVPTTMQVGISYRPSKRVAINADLQKDIDFDTSVLIGLSYALVDRFVFRTGFNTHPSRQFFGLEFKPNNLRMALSYSLSHQQLLGLSHQVSIQYRSKGKK